jgi:hypothetical protein
MGKSSKAIQVRFIELRGSSENASNLTFEYLVDAYLEAIRLKP